MIHSRAFLLLRKELIFFQQEEQQEISVSPVKDDMFHWNATVRPKDSLWEGGIFETLIHFTADYNYTAPKIQFLTIPFHPNVDAKTGEVFLDIIHTWCEENNMSQLLHSLLGIFDVPELRDGAILNKDAAKMLQSTPHTYRQLALDCVAASLRIQSGRTPHGAEVSKESISVAVLYKPNEDQRHRSKPISFVHYQTFWKGIATSIADKDGSTVLQTGINNNYAPAKTDEDLLKQTIQFQDMIHRYQSLKYGIIRSRKPSVKSKQYHDRQAEHMDQLRTMYHDGTADVPNKSSSENKDVQQLLDWTEQLNPDHL